MLAHERLGPSHLLSKLAQSPWTLRLLISALLVIPCVWQPIVSVVDLQSHLYNAWLAELIRSGGIHGLWIGHQNTNLVVDLLFAWLLKIVGVSGAERVVTSTLVLVFFWGALQFISAVCGRSVYWLAPWLAVLSYGFTFQYGLLNFYISCAVVLWLLAIVWRKRVGWRMLWTTPLLLLAYLAHPLPVLWFLGVAVYCQLAERLQLRTQVILFIGSLVGLSLIRGYIVTRYITIWMPRQLAYWTGADQALLFGWPYLVVAAGFLLFSVVVLVESTNRWAAAVSVSGQAYFLTAVAIILIPSAIRASPEQAWISHLADRLSLLSGVMLLSVVGSFAYRRWYLPVGFLAAAIFFGALHHDIGNEARVEAKMQELVQAVPAGERVVLFDHISGAKEHGELSKRGGRLTHVAGRLSSIFTSRLNSRHLLSRACLGHCYDYTNYEPSTSQFRIHAAQGNPIVMANYADVAEMTDGTYVVKENDLPLHALLRCGAGPDDMQLRSLAKGESGEMLACVVTAAAQ